MSLSRRIEQLAKKLQARKRVRVVVSDEDLLREVERLAKLASEGRLPPPGPMSPKKEAQIEMLLARIKRFADEETAARVPQVLRPEPRPSAEKQTPEPTTIEVNPIRPRLPAPEQVRDVARQQMATELEEASRDAHRERPGPVGADGWRESLLQQPGLGSGQDRDPWSGRQW